MTNSSTGAFTCPDDSLYLFMWSGTSSKGDNTLNLMIDSVRKAATLQQEVNGSYDDSGTSGTSSQTFIHKCSPGSVITLSGWAVLIQQNLMADFCTFSGHRLPGQ